MNTYNYNKRIYFSYSIYLIIIMFVSGFLQLPVLHANSPLACQHVGGPSEPLDHFRARVRSNETSSVTCKNRSEMNFVCGPATVGECDSPR